MKNRIISLIVGVLVLVALACEPIEDRDVLSNNVADVSQVELIVSNPGGGNDITMKMNTPGVTGYWNYSIGKAMTNEYTFKGYPVTGEAKVTFIGTLGKEFFEKSVTVNVEALTTAVSPMWTSILGDDAIAGKTWVFDGVGGDNNIWWCMVAPYNWQEVWWNAGGTCCPPSDAAGEMTFDLDGNANFTHKLNGVEQKGTFVLNTEKGILKFLDAPMLGSLDGRYAKSGEYQIKEISDNVLLLYAPDSPDGDGFTGWVWRFKPKA